MPPRKDMPATLKRSPKKAQETWAKTHDSAVETYGEGERAHRTAFSSLKHSFEKVGDHWEPKDAKGPSDKQAARSGQAPARPARPPAGSTPTRPRSTSWRSRSGWTIRGRSRMTKGELVEAIGKANNRESARSLRKGR